MTHSIKYALTAIATCAIVAPATAMSPAGEEAMNKAGQIMFEHRCRSCHSDDPSAASYGPSLIGVVGRKAGSVPGFSYSDAMKSSGIVWTDEALRAWIANNTGIMPGTRMKHMNITDTNEQDFLIAYLKSLK